MKKTIASLSLALLGFTALQAAPPESNTARVDVSRLANDENRTYRGDHDWERENRGGGGAENLARLNGEVRRVRMEIGESSMVGRRIRDRFHQVLEATENLNARFRRGSIRGWEVRDRAEAIRGQLDWIRRDLREQRGGHRHEH